MSRYKKFCLAVGASIVLFVASMVLFQLRTAVVKARAAARHATCISNMKAIGLALLNYQQEYDALPPAYVPDSNGTPMHSWRVLILPYLGEEEVYRQYRFDEPWNGPHNEHLITAMPYCYACPDDPDATGGRTSYVVVNGAGCAWAKQVPVRLAKNDDRVLAVEAAGSGVCWLEPRDLALHDLMASHGGADCAIRGNHSGGPSVLTASNVLCLSPLPDLDLLRGMLTDGAVVARYRWAQLENR